MSKGAQFPGRRITMGAPNHCGGAEKSQQCLMYFLQYSTFSSERPQVWTWGRQTCFLPRAPSYFVTPLQVWEVNLKIRLYEFHPGYCCHILRFWQR